MNSLSFSLSHLSSIKTFASQFLSSCSRANRQKDMVPQITTCEPFSHSGIAFTKFAIERTTSSSIHENALLISSFIKNVRIFCSMLACQLSIEMLLITVAGSYTTSELF
jgi:hypothetical protein